jgi:DNA-binding protein H-NS
MQLAKLRKAKAEIEKKEQALLNRSQEKIIEKIVQLAVVNKISAAQIAKALKSKKTKKGERSKQRTKKSVASRGKAAPKYRNPADPEQTWTGRGRLPKWAAELQKNGILESALIKPGE